MEAKVLARDGTACSMQMGCYGIGVTRVVAAAIEQNNDERGIVWPDAIAPFDVSLVPINLDKSYRVREAADALYAQLREAGFEVLFDDRENRPGVKFADADLIGIPHRFVVAEKSLDRGHLEYKSRRASDPQMIPASDAIAFLEARLSR